MPQQNTDTREQAQPSDLVLLAHTLGWDWHELRAALLAAGSSS